MAKRASKSEATQTIQPEAPKGPMPIKASTIVAMMMDHLNRTRQQSEELAARLIQSLQEGLIARHALPVKSRQLAESQAEQAVYATACNALSNSDCGATFAERVANLLKYADRAIMSKVEWGFSFNSSCQISNVLDAADLSATLQAWSQIKARLDGLLDPSKIEIVDDLASDAPSEQAAS